MKLKSFLKCKLSWIISRILTAWILLNPISSIYAQDPSDVLSQWQGGYMDIHHINTGMGDCTFFVFPDGTTMLFDAGEMDLTNPRTKGPRNTPQKPDTSKTPGEWIVEYLRFIQEGLPKKEIDFAVISHFHDDHMGNPHSLSKSSKSGTYKLTGITTVGEHIRIKKLIDRGWPDYNYPQLLDNAMMKNYSSFIDWQTNNNGMTVEQFLAGQNNQITLQNNEDKYPTFEVRNISVNGEVWSGVANNTRANFPEIASLRAQSEGLPGENPCSISFRISYGKFDYYTGGDLPGILEPGDPLWKDMETPVAKAVGPVEVNVLNHHGNRDAQNAFFLKSLRPRVHIISVWSSDHPGNSVLRRLLNQHTYQGPRDIFATNMLEPNYHVIGPRLEQLKSAQGHIVVRVNPGGESYKVIILEDSDATYKVKATFGPYTSR